VDQQKKLPQSTQSFFSAVFAGSLLSSRSYTLRPLRNPLRTLRLNKPKLGRELKKITAENTKFYS
jgi:hypothetical protein